MPSPKTKLVILFIGLGLVLVITWIKSYGPSPASSEQKTKSDVGSAPPYGTEVRFNRGCLAGKSERDLVELVERAKADDELSIRQMISGGLAWQVPIQSRATVLGGGAFSNAVEVKFMDGRRGWVPAQLIK